MIFKRNNKIKSLYKQFNTLKSLQGKRERCVIQKIKIDLVNKRKPNYCSSYKNSKYKNVLLAYRKIKLFYSRFTKELIKQNKPRD